MQGDTSTSDGFLGAIILAVALPLIYGAGVLLARVKNARFRLAWSPLIPLVDEAEVVNDGGGAASSVLRGRYRGAPVAAVMAPDTRAGPNSTLKGNRFEVTAREVPGRLNWSVVWSDQFLGFGTTGFQIHADDPALAERLAAAGVLELAARLGRVDRVDFSAGARALTLREQVQPLWHPPPERFRLELDVLLELAAANAAVNAA